MAYRALEQLNKMYDGYKRAFSINGLNLLLVQEGGSVFLIENRCPHMDVSLETGTLVPGQKIRCRAHGIEFELGSGKATGPLAETLDCLNRYTPIYEGSTIGVEL